MSNAPSLAPAIVLTGVGLLLCAGLLTPVAGVIIAAYEAAVAFAWTSAPSASTVYNLAACVLVAAVAAALVMVGPGAYALDARLFGRREIIIPHVPRRAGRD